MQRQDMLTLYDYNYLGDGTDFSRSEQVSPEQFLASTNHSHGSLRGTLVHTLDTEYGWRMLCQHNILTPDMHAADFPALDALTQRWQTKRGRCEIT